MKNYETADINDFGYKAYFGFLAEVLMVQIGKFNFGWFTDY